MPLHIHNQCPVKIESASNYMNGKLMSKKLWDMTNHFVANRVMLATMAKIVNQHYVNKFWDKNRDAIQFLASKPQQQQSTLPFTEPAAEPVIEANAPASKVLPEIAASYGARPVAGSRSVLGKIQAGVAANFRTPLLVSDDHRQAVTGTKPLLGSYKDPNGYQGLSITGDWLNSMYRGEFCEPQQQQQIIHIQGIGGQIWALDWNQRSTKRLRVGKGERPAGGLLLMGNEWNQRPFAGFVQVAKSYNELNRYLPALYMRCIELQKRVRSFCSTQQYAVL